MSPVVRGVEQRIFAIEADTLVDVAQVLHVGVVVTELTVLVFHLRHQDRSAAADLKREDFL